MSKPHVVHNVNFVIDAPLGGCQKAAMKKLIVLGLLAALFSMPIVAMAKDAPAKESLSDRLFPAGLSFDTFAVAKVDTDNGNRSDYGGGLGLNAFFNKHFGIGVEAISSSPNQGNVIDEGNAKLIARLPVAILSPSIFAGGGRSFETEEFTAFGGAGVEIKVSKNASIFGDGRYVVQADRIRDPGYALARVGVRFNF